jgi:hypothetical protein
MKRFFLAAILGAGIVGIALAQVKDNKKNAPKEDIKVNKKYDEHGNLIQYDSTYTYNWSGDTTMINQMSPEEMKKLFKEHFNFFNDSSMTDDSFFGNFDQMFSDHFGMMTDSVVAKRFGQNHFHSFNFGNDSTENDFPDIFDNFFGFTQPDKNDSILAKNNKAPHTINPQSMNDIMQMMQQQMQQMEEMQRQFFEEHKPSKNQENSKEF